MPKGTVVAVALAALLCAAGAGPARKPAKATPTPASPGAVIVLDSPKEAGWTGERISLDLKDADIKDVLKTFAKLGRFSVVIDPEVKGAVTVRLENVPWDQALDVILRVNGLGYVLEGKLVRVGVPSKL